MWNFFSIIVGVIFIIIGVFTFKYGILFWSFPLVGIALIGGSIGGNDKDAGK